jgi:hypothetical protein
MQTQEKIALAHEKMNALNEADPNHFETPLGPRPRELWMAERLEHWVHQVADPPSTALLLAARCQHLMRWRIPRSDYDQGRIGYLKWRKDLAKMHADAGSEILREVAFDAETIEQVREINLKQNLKTNPDVQAMEDALCLCFLEQEYAAFAEKHENQKVIEIVQKTWRKMSAVGQRLALELPLSGRPAQLVRLALAGH